MKRFTLCLGISALVFAITGQALAAITGVAGPVSSMGSAPAIIPPPPHLLDDVVTNTGMQGLNEAQGIVTTIPHAHDAGVIPAGTLVDSHMIFLNSEGNASLSHRGVTWTFSGSIIGVMSDQPGTLEAASTFELGAPGTNYTVTFPGSGPAAPYPARGMEGDTYAVSSNQITVNMGVSEPGDWIRVITSAVRAASPGYWKNHPAAWPVTQLVICGTEYSRDEAIEWMDQPKRGDMSLAMFTALAAAKLNEANGCNASCVGEAMKGADAWMAQYGPVGSGVKAKSEAWKQGEPLHERLDAYNNGELPCALGRE